MSLNINNKEFIISDGSPFQDFWDCHTLKEIRKIPVYARQDDSPEIIKVAWLNDLETVHLEKNRRAKSVIILVNIYGEDVLVLQINPQSDELTQIYDFTMLFPRQDQEDAFNGISLLDEEVSHAVFVTGKNWPHIYKVKLKT